MLTVYNAWRTGTLDPQGGLVATIVAILVVATLLWATVLTLKKRRILVAE